MFKADHIHGSRLSRTGLAIMVLLLCFCPDTEARDKKTVFVIKSRVIRPYEEAYSGFRKELSARAFALTYLEHDLQKFSDDLGALIKEVDRSEANIVLVIGTEAAVFARRSIKTRPVVFTMLLNPVENGIVDSFQRPGGNITGVSLNISLQKQFSMLKKIVPRIDKVGMLYDVVNRRGFADEAIRAAEKSGLKLISKPVYDESEISPKLDEVLAEADCLWAEVDPMIYNSSTARNIILSTLRADLPFMAFSENFVRAGALMALKCDYHDIGRQSAEIAVDILENQKTHNIPVKRPRKTHLVINVRTAEIIGVDIPAEHLEEAVVYGR
ncbi:MAG: hypothetical protein GF409_06195 [Candidatus Omnitrophica bacterium]|nr:hypothetical protein [Candidatus Omnitrophota bacterium]